MADIPAFIVKLPVPKTQKLTFETVLKGVDKPTQENLSAISQVREDMRALIDGETANPQSIQAVERYTPSLFGLMLSAEGLPPDFSKWLRIIWTTPVCTRNMNNSFVYPGFRFEVVMCLLTYGILMRNYAKDIFSSTNFGSSDFEEKSKVIASNLCRAAGVFEHISDKVLSEWKVKPDVHLPEAMNETYIALTDLCLAEAQEITVKKGLLKGTSGAALSKVCVDIYQKYEHALSVLKGMPGSDLLNPALTSYLSVNIILWKGITFKILAQDAYSKGSYGQGVAYMEEASNVLIERKEPMLEPFISLYKEERENVKMLLSQYKSDNDTIYFEPIPKDRPLPEAKCLAKIVPFQPSSIQPVPIVQEKGSECCIQ